jgi:hypothetical protein
MIKSSTLAAASMLGVILGVGGGSARAQIRAVGPGSTVAGDRLRGEGVYLQGLGWYELNAAQARRRDAETEKKLYDWNRQLYNDYMRERDAEINRKKNLTKAQAEEAARRYREHELRLRTSPDDDDIRSGAALNAMLTDLSNPSIAESSWRSAQVPLPDDLSIKHLVFRFAAKSGTKGSQELGRAVIALGRLDTEGRWPGYIPTNSLVAERGAYEASYRKIRDRCLAGRLDSAEVLEMDRAVRVLKEKVPAAVPAERGWRASAVRFVGDLEKATRIFDAATYDYARDIISDTQKHEARTVGELLAFMRKYRLMFAPAESAPDTLALYGRLYDLLRKQAASLRLKGGEGPAAVAAASPVVGRWLHAPNGRSGREIACRPDGTIEIGGRIAGFWSQGGAVTTLRWPTKQVREEVFVDEVRLSSDGRLYEGTNQFGQPIQGVRVDAKAGESVARAPKDGLLPGRVWKGLVRYEYPADLPQAMTHELEITGRAGDEFEGVTKVHDGAHERVVKGTVSGGRVSFKMTKLIKGKALPEPTTGVISGDKMTLEVEHLTSDGRRGLARIYLKLVEQ